jgi:phage-related minor tail protein
VAAAAALTFAYSAGSKEAQEYNRAIIMTGNAAGVTSGQMQDMARNVSKTIGTQGAAAAALTEIVGTGRVASESLQRFTQVAIQMERTVGQSVADTAKDLAALGKAPVDASEKLNEKFRYLTSTVYQQIKALQDQGKTEEAGALAQKAYADAFDIRTKQLEANLGTIERGWNSVVDAAKGGWDAILGIGRPNTNTTLLKSVSESIAAAESQISRLNQPSGGLLQKLAVDYLQNKLVGLREEQSLLQENVRMEVRSGAAAAENNRQNEARIAWDKESEKYLTRRELLERELTAERNKGIAAGATEEELQKRLGDVRKKYADIYNDTIDSQIEAIKRRSQIEEDAAKRASTQIQVQRQLGELNEEQAIQSVAKAELAAFDKRKAALLEELALIKSKQNSLKDQQGVLGQIGKLNSDRLTRETQLTNDLLILESKRTRLAAENYANLIGQASDEAEKLRDQVKAQNEYNETIGLSARQVADVESARLYNIAAIKEEKAELADLVDISGQLGDEYREQAAELRKLASGKQFAAQKQEAVGVWRSIDSAAHDTFIHIFESGKSAFDRLRDTLKSGLLDLLYQMTVRQWIFSIGASVSGVSGIANAAGGAGNALGTVSNGMSLYSGYSMLNSNNVATTMGSLGYANGGGAAINSAAHFSDAAYEAGYASAANGYQAMPSAGFGQYVPVVGGALSAYGVSQKHGPVAGMAAGAGSVALGGAVSGAAAGTGMMAGAGAALAAIPVWGWAALAVASILGGMDDGPEQHTNLRFGSNKFNVIDKDTYTVNGRADGGGWVHYDQSINGGNYAKGVVSNSKFGSFGVEDTFWQDTNQPVVTQFVKTVEQVDNALATFLTSTEISNVASRLTGVSSLAEAGAEGTDPSANGQFDKVFSERVKAIFEGVETGLSNLLDNFKGSSQELATEAAGLLDARKHLADYATIFGETVTLQQLAQLREGSETASSAITRLVTTFQLTDAVALSLGKDVSTAFGTVGLASAKAREQLVAAAGGLDNLQSQASFFAQNFLTEAEQMAPVIRNVASQMEALGSAGVTTKEGFAGLVKGLDLATESGAEMYAKLMALAPQFLQYANYLAKGTTEIQSTAKQNLDSLRSELSDAYNREAGDIQNVIDKFAAFSTELRDFRSNLLLGDLSPLSPIQKYQEAKDRFDRTYSLAKAGDPAAMGNLTNVAQQFLQASQAVNASSEAYARDYQKVDAALASAANAADTQVNIARDQLAALNRSVAGIVDVIKAVQSVDQLLAKYFADGGTRASSSLSSSGVSGVASSLLGDAGGGADWSNNSAYSHPSGVTASDSDSALITAAKLVYQSATGGVSTAQFNNAAAAVGGDIYAATGWNGDPASFREKWGFAKGGIFTNGVVSQPTDFEFGQMGEAGNPEAIMPLVRTNGGLAVRSVGGGSGDSGGETAAAIDRQTTAIERSIETMERMMELIAEGQLQSSDDLRTHLQHVSHIMTRSKVPA